MLTGAASLPRPWLLQHRRAHGLAALTQSGLRARPAPSLQHKAPLAAYKANPKYNKYRNRQTIEKEYYREWERTTALNESYFNRQRTLLSTAANLPLVIKYYIVPGPVRYVWFFIWQAIVAVARQVYKRLLLQGCKLEAALQPRVGRPATVQRRMALLRWHGRVALLESVKYWLALLLGKPYTPQLSPPEEGEYGPNYMPRGTVEVVLEAA